MTGPVPNSDPSPTVQPIDGNSDSIGDPIFLLSPPLSLSSYACAMLGQHTQLYALPETHLFLADTLASWWDTCSNSSFDMAHGLLRVIAQLFFGGQTEETIPLAAAWLRRRLPFTTGYILELIAARVQPRRLVEKSPSMVFHAATMQRALRMFPEARFIHLLQHPHSHAQAVIAAIQSATAHQVAVPRWLRQLACFSATEADEHSQERFEIDPQQAWHALNTNICEFLDTVPDGQKMRVRGEDLITSPDSTLRGLVDWLALRADDEAVEAMKHPERSPYACFGPRGAKYGDSPHFLRSPALPAPPVEPDNLDAPFPWRDDGERFCPEVKALARQLGYQ